MTLTPITGALPSTERVTLPPLRVVALWLRRFRSQATRATYRSAFMAFCALTGRETGDAASALFAADEHDLNATVDVWAATMREEGLSPATINVRLAALSSLLKYGRQRGATRNRLDTAREKARAYRDTAGPPIETIRALFAEARRGADSIRDEALLAALFLMGLRRGEVSALNVGDVTPGRPGGRGSVMVRGKGSGGQEEPESLEGRARDALAVLLHCRPSAADAPLFVSIGGRTKGARLTPHGIRAWLAALCRRADVPHVSPHALRHAFVTIALDAGADQRSVSAAARHKDLTVTARYDDNRRAAGGGVSRLLSEALDAEGD